MKFTDKNGNELTINQYAKLVYDDDNKSRIYCGNKFLCKIKEFRDDTVVAEIVARISPGSPGFAPYTGSFWIAPSKLIGLNEAETALELLKL
jgi:hypothetical protein